MRLKISFRGRQHLLQQARRNLAAFIHRMIGPQRDHPRVLEVMEAGLAPRRVLVVDDDDLLRENFCFILQRAGYDALASASGEEALQAARKRLPHVITLDVAMPGLDGFAVLASLKQEPALQSVPVLMMTSSRSEGDVRRARELGAATYLAKPVDAKSLLSRISLLLPVAPTDEAQSNWPDLTSRVEWLD